MNIILPLLRSLTPQAIYLARLGGILLITYFLLITAALSAEKITAQKEKLEDIEITLQLHIGIEDNRVPYSFLDANQQPTGILVHGIKQLCEKIKAECSFHIKGFDQMLQELQTLQLQSMTIIDSLVLPDIDQLSLTTPICRIEPVFIQRQTNKPRTQPEDFRQSTLGVLGGSLLHLYLLDEYSSYARLKPYLILESGILDLLSGRIDGLFADRAFFNARIDATSLVQDNSPEQLNAFAVSNVELEGTTMALAIHVENTDLIKRLAKAIGDKQPPNCTELVAELGHQSRGDAKLVPKKSQPTNTTAPTK